MKTFNITVNGTAYNVTVEETAGGAAAALRRDLPLAHPCQLRRRAALARAGGTGPAAAPACVLRRLPAQAGLLRAAAHARHRDR